MKNKFRLTKREKFIVAASIPTYGGFATRKEVAAVYKKARGHCFDDHEYEMVCAVSPTGRREFFEYNLYSWATPHKLRQWWLHAMRCGRLWAQGKYKAATILYSEIDNV